MHTNHQLFLRKLLNSCDDLALSEAEYHMETQPHPLSEQGYNQTRNVNLLKRWVEGKNIPATIRSRMIEYFKTEEPEKIWKPVVEALEKNNPRFLEAA